MTDLEMELVAKIDRKEKLTSQEIQDFLECGEEVAEIKGTSHRWEQEMKTIIDIEGRTFCVEWMRGLTEYQDNTYTNTPYEVYKQEYEEIVKRVKWIPVV